MICDPAICFGSAVDTSRLQFRTFTNCGIIFSDSISSKKKNLWSTLTRLSWLPEDAHERECCARKNVILDDNQSEFLAYDLLQLPFSIRTRMDTDVSYKTYTNLLH